MITAIVLTLNNEKTLGKTLSSLSFLNEVLVFDTGSSDTTLLIARSFKNVKIKQSIFKGFGKVRNEAAVLAKNNWILSIDSDEVLSPDLIEEIKKTKLSSNTAYSFPFINFFNNKQIHCCGWHNERHIRLYNRQKTAFSKDFVHERVLVNKKIKIQKFKHPIFHYSMQSIDDFLKKIQKYSTLYAEEYQGIKKSSAFKAFFHGLFAFLKSYFFQKGFLYGKEGLIISIYNSSCSFYKYLKLEEKNHALDTSVSSDRT